MKALGWIIAVAVVILALIFVFGYLVGNPADSGLPQYNDTDATVPDNTATTTGVRVTNPTPNMLVTSPLEVTGEARGNWFFEANLPVRLLDASGNTIVEKGAQAQGEWMTTDFVPFSTTLSFTAPSTATGTLVIMKDNPSGLPENAGEVRIPVRFR